MTPACVALDRAGIEYSTHPYDHDPANCSFGLEAAHALKVDPALVFKTLIAELDHGELVVAIVAVTGSLDLKALARASGAKKARMADVTAAERTSGYVSGGISPFGQRSRRRTFVDVSALDHPCIYVSGGKRGLDISLSPADLIAVLDAEPTPISA